jgi:F-type H+-transporting ATPase subunit b
MGKQSLWKRLLLLVVLVAGLSLHAVVAFAQDNETPATEEAAQAGTEESAAAEGEAEEGEPEEAATSPLTPLGINTGFLLAQIVNFGIIFFLLTTALWRPMRNMLDSRAAAIQKGLEDAAAAANARRNAETEADSIRASARGDVSRSIEEARTRADAMIRDAERSAAEEAERIRAEARAQAEEERNRQLGELRGQVAAIGIAVAERLIGQSMDASRQQALINDFFAKVPADARAMAGDVEVIVAMPLSADEEAAVRREVGGGNVTFTVDPSILGGMIVRSADRVVDGSVRNSLTDLSSRMR